MAVGNRKDCKPHSAHEYAFLFRRGTPFRADAQKDELPDAPEGIKIPQGKQMQTAI